MVFFINLIPHFQISHRKIGRIWSICTATVQMLKLGILLKNLWIFELWRINLILILIYVSLLSWNLHVIESVMKSRLKKKIPNCRYFLKALIEQLYIPILDPPKNVLGLLWWIRNYLANLFNKNNSFIFTFFCPY